VRPIRSLGTCEKHFSRRSTSTAALSQLFNVDEGLRSVPCSGSSRGSKISYRPNCLTSFCKAAKAPPGISPRVGALVFVVVWKARTLGGLLRFCRVVRVLLFCAFFNASFALPNGR
jgi:hypothetical protein